MDSINHQMMGYDRAITMFSPDGRLLQVEYAKKTVKQGSTAIGMVCADGVLLVTDKRIVDPLVVTEAIEKIFQIDDHMGATASGIISDARVLIERAQVKAQQHRVTYDSQIDVLSIVKNVCDLKQLCTQSGGLRPFGVSVLVAGIDVDGPKLFETDPTGIFFQYNAVVIGEGEEGIEEILHKKYKPSISLDDGLKLCVDSLKIVLDDNFNAERLDAAMITTADKTFRKVDRKELDKIFKQVTSK
ncbi:archaeal proteasome endopeptidase complex subunit alpha [Nanoarchaeota archaeon]